jgi:two-component system response regulator YesN
MGSPAPPATLDAACINRAAFEYYGRLGRVKQYIDAHFTEDITLKVAADIACLEEKYFSNFFHAKTGLRFVDFVSYVRVEHAKQLIEDHNSSISKIAEDVGYHNRRTFERAFKKWTGITPTEFKAIVRPC